jgi:hypothetical protein
MGAGNDRNGNPHRKGRIAGMSGQGERQQRLAEALRANLQKRKEQARSRKAPAPDRRPPEKP